MTLILSVILVALIFEYINGFHDTANSIATVVSTKVLTPRNAIMLAAATNLVGALFGFAVAKTISSGLVEAKFVSTATIVCALWGGIVWNLLTWWFGLPSSSTHAMVGGLIGAAIASAGPQWGEAVIWAQADGRHWWEHKGVLYKVVIPMITSPVIGLFGGMLLMSFLYGILRKATPSFVNRWFGKLQLLSAGYMGFSHGTNDAQKTMGIIALALAGATAGGVFDEAPGFLQFLYQPDVGSAVYKSEVRLAEIVTSEISGPSITELASTAGWWIVGGLTIVLLALAFKKKIQNVTAGISIIVAVLIATLIPTFFHDANNPKELLSRAAKGKNVEANWILGEKAYKKGDLEKAADYLKLAATDKKAPHPDAMKLYAEMLREGKGVDKADPAAADKLIADSAKAEAPKKWSLSAPKVEEVDRFKAMPKEPGPDQIAFLQKLADNRSAAAQVLLGIAHAKGTGTEKNDAKARELFEAAAKRNNPEGLYNLALFHAEGKAGLTADKTQIKAYLTRAADLEGIPLWIKIACAITMALGTAAGGWKIIKTMGHKMVKLQPVHGFAAETTAATVLMTAQTFGMPVSTTHAITTNILGVGCAKSWRALNFPVISKILWAWVLTIPMTALMGWLAMKLWLFVGWPLK